MYQQEKIEELSSFFADPLISIQRGHREGADKAWVVQAGEFRSTRIRFFGKTIDEALDAAIAEFRRKPGFGMKPERRR
jgi:hypothetical protein